MARENNPVLSSIDLGVRVPGNEISVYFAKDGESFDIVTNEGSWTRYERAQAMAALEAYAAVADLTFRETADPAAATFRLTKSASPFGSHAFMNPPDPEYGDTQGIAWFNTYENWSGPGGGLLDPGSYAYTIFLHEFGHGLGLAHPFEASGGSTVMPGIGPGLGLDQGVFTVMSYNDGWPEAPEGSPESAAFGWNLGLSPIDIAVIQGIYGVNTETGAGNDRYRLPEADGPGAGYSAIWDAGGRDAIVHGSSAAAVIDLRAATLLPEAGGGGFVSHVIGVHGGFTIANGVVIEKAVGGAGDDTITGNDADNTLNGRGGADRLAGGRGDDLYLLDDPGDEIVEARGEGRDTIRTGAIDIDLRAFRFVEDVALTGRRDLDAKGSGAANRLSGNGGDNTLTGKGGADTLEGGGGHDSLLGGGGNDVLIGGPGRDTLDGGAGADTLTGGAGRDVFAFHHARGTDTVTDFEIGTDRIAIAADSFADLAIRDRPFGTLVVGDAINVRLEGIAAHDLDEASFLF